MTSDMTVQTEVALRKIRHVSHMRTSQIRTEKIRFHVICAVVTIMEKTRSESYMREKISDLSYFSCSVKVA